jgi:hypothetical protein
MKIWDIATDDQIKEGDNLDLELGDVLVETRISEILEDGVVIEYDAKTLELIMEYKTSRLDEAEYQGRKVPLGKPMKGDVAKRKVYVRKPNGKVVKVNFGDKEMRIKKSNPARRKSFRARHNCQNPGPKWKARYWSCRQW